MVAENGFDSLTSGLWAFSCARERRSYARERRRKPWTDVEIRKARHNGGGGENETQASSTVYERGDRGA